MKRRMKAVHWIAVVTFGLLFRPTTADADLAYHGGPVLRSFQIVPYYYGPWTDADITAHQDYLVGLAQYMTGLNAPANMEPMLVQYGVLKATVANAVKNGAVANPIALDTPGGLQVIHDAQGNGTLPPYAPNRLIMLLLPHGAVFTVHCAYHGAEAVGQYYAFVSQDCFPYYEVTAHEVFEAATDPAINVSNAWDEAVDPCATDFTLSFGPVPGAFDNEAHACSTTGYAPITLGASYMAVDAAFQGSYCAPGVNCFKSELIVDHFPVGDSGFGAAHAAMDGGAVLYVNSFPAPPLPCCVGPGVMRSFDLNQFPIGGFDVTSADPAKRGNLLLDGNDYHDYHALAFDVSNPPANLKNPTAVAMFAGMPGLEGMTIGPDWHFPNDPTKQTLYVLEQTQIGGSDVSKIYSLDPNAANPQPVEMTGLQIDGHGDHIALDPTGQYLYVSDIGPGNAMKCDLLAVPQHCSMLASASDFANVGAYGVDGVAFLLHNATCAGCKDQVVGPVFNFNSGTVVLVDESGSNLKGLHVLARMNPVPPPQMYNEFRGDGVAAPADQDGSLFTMNAAQIWRIFDPGPGTGAYYFLLPGDSPAANRRSSEIAANQAPVSRCRDAVAPADALCQGTASVDDGSFDPDPGDTFHCLQSPAGPFPLGNYAVTLTCTDERRASSSCQASVRVVDTIAPTISALSASPNVLWPPNHQMVPVTVAVTASDVCDSDPRCRITSVMSNEPATGLGDGNTAPDWQITGDLTVDLRAERSGSGSGRVYTITVQCSDFSNNSSSRATMITVANDQR
jgi:hypothetical protein